MLTCPTGFLLVARSDHTTGSRNVKPEVVFKVQKMARYASFCFIISHLTTPQPACRIFPACTKIHALVPELSRKFVLHIVQSTPPWRAVYCHAWRKQLVWLCLELWATYNRLCATAVGVAYWPAVGTSQRLTDQDRCPPPRMAVRPIPVGMTVLRLRQYGRAS